MPTNGPLAAGTTDEEFTMSNAEKSASSLRRPGTKVVRQRSIVSNALVPPGRTWTITTRDGYTVRGYLPGWAEEDPSQVGIPSDRLSDTLHDVIHRATFDGELIRLARGGYGPGEHTWVFGGHIECILDADDRPPVPTASIHFFEDYWLSGLGPNQLARFAAQLRAQADRLDDDVRPRLAAYQADWSAHCGRPIRQRNVPRRRA
jgi:hypothetical protein